MRSILFLVFLCAFTTVAWAQSQPDEPAQQAQQPLMAAGMDAEAESAEDTEIERLKRQVRALTVQVEALENVQEETKDDLLSQINVSGKVFAGYWWNYSGTAAQKNFNRFQVDRMYLTVKGNLSERFSFRGTTDIYTSRADANLSSVVILKYAYVDWKASSWLKLRAGVIPTVWIDHMNKVWGYRGVAKVLADQEKFQPSADIGLSALVQLPSKRGEVVVNVQNGSGYRKPESNRYKDVSARLVLKPFANAAKALQPLQVSGHVYEGRFDTGDRRTRWGGLAFYKTRHFSAGVNYDVRQDSTLQGKGFSVFGEIKLGRIAALKDFSLIGRWETYDPDTATSDDDYRRTIGGLAYKPTSRLTLVMNAQHVTRSAVSFERYDGTLTRNDGRFALHAIVTF